jgi:hypothetical protein
VPASPRRGVPALRYSLAAPAIRDVHRSDRSRWNTRRNRPRRNVARHNRSRGDDSVIANGHAGKDPPLPELWAGLRDKTRNVIRRARERLTVQCIEDVSQFTRFYKENLEDDVPYFSLAASAAATAAACDHKQGKIVAATGADGVAHAMVVFLWDDHQVYYFHSSRRKNAHAGAVSLLLWTGIELAHSRGLWFDFDAGLAKVSRYKFLVSFGGEIANRYEVTRSTRIYRVQHGIRRICRAMAHRLPIVSLKKNYGFLWWIVSSLCFT